MKNQYLTLPLLMVSMVVVIPIQNTAAAKRKATQQPTSPNIFLIFTDQQNINAMSAAGNPLLKTPNMDKLADDGVRFTKAYCTSPVSGPSRASIITGLMPSETGFDWNNRSVLNDDTQTIGHLLSTVGYKSVWAGKWHLPDTYPQQKSDTMFHLKGFDFLPFWKAPERRWLLGAETDPPLTTAVENYLDNYDKKQPLFLAVSYHNPHDICFYPRKIGWETEKDSLLDVIPFGKYKLPAPMGVHPDSLQQLPDLPFNHSINKNEPEFVRDKRVKENSYGDEVKLAAKFTDDEWRAYLYSYYRLTELVDIEIGKIMDALKRNKMYDNSLIIFTSDHGDGMAAHKWASKLSLYEESAQVPFIILTPTKRNQSIVDSKSIITLADIVPTICDYAGVKTDIDFAGVSLRSTVENLSKLDRDYIVCELADDVRNVNRKGRMIRSDRFKYNFYSQGLYNEQLFDLVEDPGEKNNLAHDIIYAEILRQHREYLKQWLKERNDNFIRFML
ncbi:MAG: sulfatase-like hydrolase/transferase [Lentimicrobium sp.]|jgi:arylsulfatase A-like enzyme|nr:sulfatase-like hydrolase/transferase [Lentimicrobium sp.]